MGKVTYNITPVSYMRHAKYYIYIYARLTCDLLYAHAT